MSNVSWEPALPQPVGPPRFRVRLVHFVYIGILLAMSWVTFGPEGIIPGVAFVGFWAIVFASSSRPRAFLIAGLLMLLVIACLVPARSAAREAARRMSCGNNLKQIALALHGYHEKHGRFPPAYVADENGRPKHSWRVLILPFMEQQSLYDAYDFDEPWDGPHNRPLLGQRPSEYACPSQHDRPTQTATCTNYVAVVGPTTAWPGPVSRRLSDFEDPTSGTLLLVESGDDIHWTEPRDLAFADALERLTSTAAEQPGGHRSEDFFHVQFIGRNAATVDGEVVFLDSGLGRGTWHQLLSDNDGAPSSTDGLDPGVTLPRTLKIGNCIRLAVWIVVVLFPLPWVWLNRTPAGMT